MKEQEIIEPLYKKAQNAVDAVAQERDTRMCLIALQVF